MTPEELGAWTDDTSNETDEIEAETGRLVVETDEVATRTGKFRRDRGDRCLCRRDG